MTLPEIPDAALDAANTAAGDPFVSDSWQTPLRAAWPHLYAAALRHAASEMSADRYKQRSGAVVGVLLRRLADEAAP